MPAIVSLGVTHRAEGRWMPASCVRRRHASILLLLALCAAACAPTPAPGPESAAAVRTLWSAYLTSKRGQYAQRANEPSPHWDADEQARWPLYDLAGFYLPDGAVPEVLSVTPVNARVDTAYRIVTRFWPAGTTVGDSAATPALTMTVYARRQRAQWVLANALTYHTATWRRETRGRITFHIAPALSFNATRAEHAAAFVDSMAQAFDVAPPPRLEYYVTESVDQALAAQGTVYAQRFGAAGGFAKPVNFQVFSGIPALGEAYRHEIAHVVLMPVIRDRSTSLLASEGVPTWLGGSAGRDYVGAVRHMDSLLVAQPAVTLDRIVFDMGVTAEIRNAAGAVLAEMVHEAGGVAAVRAYLQTPSVAMRAFLERRLARPWAEVATAWRARVRRIAGSVAASDQPACPHLRIPQHRVCHA